MGSSSSIIICFSFWKYRMHLVRYGTAVQFSVPGRFRPDSRAQWKVTTSIIFRVDHTNYLGLITLIRCSSRWLSGLCQPDESFGKPCTTILGDYFTKRFCCKWVSKFVLFESKFPHQNTNASSREWELHFLYFSRFYWNSLKHFENNTTILKKSIC